MFKIVSSKNYKKLQDELNGLHSVNSEKSVAIEWLEARGKSLENTIKQRGEKVQAMREQIDAMRAVSKRRERKIEEIETELKLCNAALSRKAEEVLKLTAEKSRMHTQLKDSMAEITRLSVFTAPAETTESIIGLKKGMFVKAPEGCAEHITPGKIYEVLETKAGKSLFEIKADDGYTAQCLLNGCAHLNEGNWEIVSAPAETTEQIPNAMKSVEMPNIETKSDAIQKPAKRKYFRSGKFKKQK